MSLRKYPIYFLCLFVLLFGHMAVFSQAPGDSLFSVWNDESQPDTSRLRAVSTLANKIYISKNPDSANYFAQLQYDLAEAGGHQIWVADAIRTQGIVFMRKGEFDQALDSV